MFDNQEPGRKSMLSNPYDRGGFVTEDDRRIDLQSSLKLHCRVSMAPEGDTEKLASHQIR